ncbi:MAG: TIGR04282 family arsenosugar biosynthesis glycosyltransferase [Candidatus Binatia bacterium]
MSKALVIFAKAPVAGQVKTRLCPPLSPQQAAELARCFLLDSVERACQLPDVAVYIAFTPADSEPLFRTLLPFPVSYLPQRGNSLGERELNIFIDLFQHDVTHAVLIGSDIPTLPLSHLHDAFSLLVDPQYDAVFGPSRDGGYYLVGLREAHTALFENITWSTESVMNETLAQARKAGLRISLVPRWYDVDDRKDLRQLVADFRDPQHAKRAPRTRALLKRLGLLAK